MAVQYSSPMRFTVEMKMGKLLEIRIKAGFRTVDDVDALFCELSAVLDAKLSAPADQKRVTVADWRQCVLLSSDAAERLQQGIAQTNPNVIRAAAIALHDSPSAVMQFLRIIRDSQHGGRRLFFEEPPLLQWLGEVLTPTETARLRVFLRER